MLATEYQSAGKMADFSNIENIEDEDALEVLISQTEDVEIRRRIRRKQNAIRQIRLAALEEARRARLGTEDALAMRLRRADEEKQRRLQEFDEMARQQKEIGARELAIRERQENAEKERQQRLDQLRESSRAMTGLYNIGVEDVMKKREMNQANDGPVDLGNAKLFETTNAGGNKPQVARQQRGLGGIQYSFKADSVDDTDKAKEASRPIDSNPAAVKQMLLDWCKDKCQGYANVNVTNFSTSWADGLAFCALVHRYYPNAFDFSKLNPQNRRGNFELAFKSAEELAGIDPLLDVEDMVRMKSPDWKCVFTYVQSFYRRFEMQK
jgi:hypothetical protein